MCDTLSLSPFLSPAGGRAINNRLSRFPFIQLLSYPFFRTHARTIGLRYIGEGSTNGREASSEPRTVGMRKGKWMGASVGRVAVARPVDTGKKCPEVGSLPKGPPATATTHPRQRLDSELSSPSSLKRSLTISPFLPTSPCCHRLSSSSQSTQARPTPEAVRLSVIRSIFLSPPPTEYSFMQRQLWELRTSGKYVEVVNPPAAS